MCAEIFAQVGGLYLVRILGCFITSTLQVELHSVGCVYVRTLVPESGKREYRIPFKKEAITSSISSGSAQGICQFAGEAVGLFCGLIMWNWSYPPIISVPSVSLSSDLDPNSSPLLYLAPDPFRPACGENS
jgi:hypothetical protein